MTKIAQRMADMLERQVSLLDVDGMRLAANDAAREVRELRLLAALLLRPDSARTALAGKA